MKLVNGRTLDWVEYGPLKDLRGTSGVIMKPMLHLDEGGPEDFDFSIVRVEKHHTPRHNHNWINLSYVREGSYNEGGKDFEAPFVFYTAEGTYYGPQENMNNVFTVAALQCGGASGQGYMGHARIRHATKELSRTGKFSKGIYETTDEKGNTVRKEAGKAVAEFLRGGPVEYPKAHYADTIYMLLKDFPWATVPGNPDLEQQFLGSFSGGSIEIRFIRGKQGSSFRQGGEHRRQLMFLDEGELELNGQVLHPESAAYTTEDESVVFRGAKDWRLMLVTLPSFKTAVQSTQKLVASAT